MHGMNPFTKPRIAELIGLPYSPWTEKARWALEVRGVPFAFRQYQPLLGEPELRLKLRRWTGGVSVPLLTDPDGHVHGDSEAIARWADTQGGPPTLFPAKHESAIQDAIALSERALAAGRALSLAATLANEDALRELVPKALRKPLGPLAVGLGRAGVKRTLRKYGAAGVDAGVHAAELAAALAGLRAAIARAPAGSSPRTLCGPFTFADIAAAQVLGFVSPPAFGIRIGRASRESFTRRELLVPYADLIQWRDALYAAYRPRTDTAA
jgi:glutathione S-transferase